MYRPQSGISRIPKTRYGRQANGLLLRGVVVATYVTDDTSHPTAEDSENPPIAVYCDVLVITALSGQRFFVLPKCLVIQEYAGLHRGRIWKPKAAKIDFLKDTLNIDGGSDPKNMNGDNVLVGFLNDNMTQPIILGALPHPAGDLGREDKELGRRMKLKAVDGDPNLWRHHGVYWGVENDGNFIIDSTFANDGSIDSDGKEPDPPIDGKGSFEFRLPQDAVFNVVLYDMSAPDAPAEVLHVTFQKDQGILDIKDPTGKFNVKIDGGENLTIEGKDGAASLVLGNGAVKATIADHLEVLWGTQKGWIEAHTHTSGTGPTGVPIQVPSTAWNSNINSQKLTFPDN